MLTNTVLSSSEFDPTPKNQAFKVDIEKNKVTYEFLDDQQRLLALTGLETPWDEKVLARWLDKHCRTPDVPQPTLMKFTLQIVMDQIQKKQVDFALLVQAKYRLAKAITRKIDQYREKARKKGYQDCLFGSEASPEVSFSYAFNFPRDQYPTSSYYQGSYRFKKHYYGNHRIGDLKEKRKDGKLTEEFLCAQAIDMHPQVKYWVRNLEKKPDTSFRLPLADGWFYPDFVALLEDGRIFVIEYKGAHLLANINTQEKANIGELWEEKSEGKGLFLIVEKMKDANGMVKQIENKIDSI